MQRLANDHKIHQWLKMFRSGIEIVGFLNAVICMVVKIIYYLSEYSFRDINQNASKYILQKEIISISVTRSRSISQWMTVNFE